MIAILAVAATLAVAVAALAATDRSTSGAPAGAPDAVPATGLFAALSHAPTAADSLPPGIRKGVDAMNAQVPAVSSDLYEGQQLPAQSRLLLSNLGAKGLSIFSYATSKGRVCFVSTAGGGGCVTAADPVGWMELLRPQLTGANVAVLGIVPNKAVSVKVIVAGSARPALLGNNAFFYSVAQGETPEQLVIGFRDGSSQRIALPDVSKIPG